MREALHRFVLEKKKILRRGNRYVYPARDRCTGQPVVLKGTTSQDSKSVSEVKQEFLLLRQLAHPALPRAICVTRIPRLPRARIPAVFTAFAQDLCEGSSLFELRGKLSLIQIREWLRQALELVAFLHHHRLTRLDLKPQHFITSESQWHLIDLDQVRPDNPFDQPELHGTLRYMAPEVIAGEPGGPSSDLFSLGATLYEAVSGTPPPLEGSTREECLTYLNRPRELAGTDVLAKEDPSLFKLLRRLLDPLVGSRPESAEAALEALSGRPGVLWRCQAPVLLSPPRQLSAIPGQDEAIEALLAWSSLPSDTGRLVVGGQAAGIGELLNTFEAAALRDERLALRVNASNLPYSPGKGLVPVITRLERMVESHDDDSIPSEVESEDATVSQRLQTRARLLANRLMAAAEALHPVLIIEEYTALDPVSHEAIHMFANRVRDAGAHLVLTSSVAPEALPLSLNQISLRPLRPEEVRTVADNVLGSATLRSRADLKPLLDLTRCQLGVLHEALTVHFRAPESDEWRLSGPVSGEKPAKKEGQSFVTPETAFRDALKLEDRFNMGERIGSEQLARAFLKSSEPARAIPYLRVAINEAEAELRLRDANELLDVWMENLSEQRPLYVELMRRKGNNLLALNRHAEAEKCFREALVPATDVEGRLRARTYAGLGQALLGRENAGALEAFQKALQLDTAPEYEIERILWRHRLAWLSLEEESKPWAQAQRQLEIARSLLPPASRLEVEQIRMELILGEKLGHEANDQSKSCDEALQMAEKLGYLEGQSRLLNFKFLLQRRMGDQSGQVETCKRLLELTHRTFDPVLEARVHYNMGLALQEQGQPSDACECFRRSADIEKRLRNERRELQSRRFLVLLFLDADLLERAKAEFERTRKLAARAGRNEPSLRWMQDLLAARIRLKEGDLEGLDEILEALQSKFSEHRIEVPMLEAAADRIELALEQGDQRKALRYFEQLGPNMPAAAAGRIWDRLHGLAIRAHEKLCTRWARVPPSPSDSADMQLPPGFSIRRPGHPLDNRDPKRDAEQLFKRVLELLEASADERLLTHRLAKLSGDLAGGRGIVRLFDEKNEAVPLSDDEEDRISSTVIRLIRESGRSLVIPNYTFDVRLNQAESLRAEAKPGIIGFPVLDDSACPIGAVVVDQLSSSSANNSANQAMVESLARTAGGLLMTIKRRRRNRELLQISGSASHEKLRKLEQQLQTLSASPASDLTVLLLGETGVGKSFLAERIHRESARKAQPFLEVNCAAIPKGLFESLVFGYKKGAFNDAYKDSPGYLEQVREGTLFLDELGELPIELQAKLLTVLSTRRFRRLGEEKDRRFSGWVISSTNRELMEGVEQGLFREDLLRRLAVHVVRIPPLRERGQEAIRELVCQIAHQVMLDENLVPQNSAPKAFETLLERDAGHFLLEHPLPWNVAQIDNMMRHEEIRRCLREGVAIPLQILKPVLEVRSLFQAKAKPVFPGEVQLEDRVVPANFFPAKDSFWQHKARCDAFLGQHIRQLNEKHGGNVLQTAAELKCSRDVIYKYIRLANDFTLGRAGQRRGERNRRPRRVKSRSRERL